NLTLLSLRPPTPHLSEPRLDTGESVHEMTPHHVDAQGFDLAEDDFHTRNAYTARSLSTSEKPLSCAIELAHAQEGRRPVVIDPPHVRPLLHSLSFPRGELIERQCLTQSTSLSQSVRKIGPELPQRLPFRHLGHHNLKIGDHGPE